MNDLVSVIIPTYNRAYIIKRAIQSVLNQTYKNLEIVIVDDGSTDNTCETVASFTNKKIKYIKQEHSNANVARNRGIRESSGKYIAFLDSDDEWEIDKIEEQLKYMRQNNAKVSFCTIKFIKENETLLFESNLSQGFVPYNELMNIYITTSCLVAERELFNENIFDEKLIRLQDWEWIVRVGENTDFYYLKKPLLKYYKTADAISYTMDDKTYIDVLYYILEKNWNIWSKNWNAFMFLSKGIIWHKRKLGFGVAEDYYYRYLCRKNLANYIKYILEKLGLLVHLKRIRNREK